VSALDEKFLTPLNSMRFQSQLGKEMERRYKEGQNIVKLSMARVVKVNYRYNTVDVVTTLHKNSTVKNPVDHGKFSARLPVSFGGTTPDGKVYGSNTLVTVGSLVLIGFMEGSKDHPIVLNIYGETNNQSQLTRTTFASADESDEDIQRELWQLFTLYPSMTFKNIDGNGNQEITFSGKSFMYITDTDPENDYVNDAEFDYDLLPSSRYANGELIEPKSPKSPTLLYVHQGVYDKHRVTFFIKSDGTVRLGSRHTEGVGVTFMEMTTDGAFQIVQKSGSTNPEEDVEKFSKMGIEPNGTVVLKSQEHLLEVNDKGVFIDGKSIAAFGGGGSDGEISFDDLLNDLEDVKTTITVINGKIETKISRTEYEVDQEAVKKYADDLVAEANQEISDLTEVVNNMDGYIDGAFYDGIVAESEAKGIETYINQLRSEKADVDAEYTEMMANTYLPTTQQTALQTAKAAYDTDFTDLIDTINAAIMDGKASAEDKAAVDLAFDDYNSSVAALSTAFRQAADAIALAQAKEAEGVAKKYTESSFKQLADQIASKVESEEFTSVIGDTNSRIADVESNLSEEITAVDGKVDDLATKIPYKAEILSTNGIVFKNGVITTTLFCKVYEGDLDITDTIDASRFKWTRVSDDAAGDDAWNAEHSVGSKSITVSGDDVYNGRTTFNCEIMEPTTA
jgi:hypothetical protein